MSTQRRRMPFRKAVTSLLTAVLAVSLLQAPEAIAAQPAPPEPTAKAKPAPAAKPKPAAKVADADCGGALAFDTIVSCEGIAADTIDTFTVSTTVANESLLFRSDTPMASYVDITLTGDNTWC